MKKQIKEYQQRVQQLLILHHTKEEWKEIKEDYLVKIQFYQHERLIHLIVTVLFALVEIMSVFTVVLSGELSVIALVLAVLILLIPYIRHYYFLENEVQKMYLIYDEISDHAKETESHQ